MLELPAETQTLGPQQVQAQFLGSPEVSSQLNLLRQNQTTIEYGNLLTLPVAGGLLYVEPCTSSGPARAPRTRCWPGCW